MIPRFALKQLTLRMVRCLLGDRRIHDALLRRSLKKRGLDQFYSVDADLPKLTQGDQSTDTSLKNYVANDVTPNSESTTFDSEPATLIFMVDGKTLHGGIADRFKGMVGAYHFAKTHGMRFKIYHPYPFELCELLEERAIHWMIAPEELSFDSRIAKPALLYRYDFENTTALERQIDGKHRQYHLYSCVDLAQGDFARDFNELFQPAPRLRLAVEQYREQLGDEFIAISFRFQNLLGDFKEFNYQPLPANLQEDLRTRAIETLLEIKNIQEPSGSIFVTADSASFLTEAARIPGVVTVQGESAHIDYQEKNSVDKFEKGYIEFFLIAQAKKAILYQDLRYKTYPSDFPKYAAKLGNIPFEIFKK